MSNIEKKAIADVVATVFLITITLLSIGIVYSAVRQSTIATLSPAITCTEMKINPPILIESACLNTLTNEIEAEIKRSAVIDIDVLSLDFRIDSETETSRFECGLTCGGNCIILNKAATKTYFFDAKNFTDPNNLVIQVNDCVLERKEITEC